MNFLKNVFVGLGGLLGLIVAILIVTILGGALWLLLTTLGLVTVGLLRFVSWIFVGGFVTIGGLWLIGYILTGSKNAE